MPRRFFAPDLAPGRPVQLPPDEARHLAAVLRHEVGDYVTAFDGRGAEFLARVDAIARGDVTLRAVARTQPAPEPRVHLTLAHAIIKGKAMDDIVRDATMLGAVAIQPLVTEYVDSPRNALRSGRLLERWSRIAVSSAKQCGRAVVPAIAPVAELRAWLNSCDSALRLILVEPRSGGVSGLESLRDDPVPASCALLIGSEGGWAPGEVTAAIDAGFRAVTLGPRVLRADAVPVAAVSVLQFIWKDGR